MAYALIFLTTGVGHLAAAALASLLGGRRLQGQLLAAALTGQGLWAVSVAVDWPLAQAAAPHLDFARTLLWILFFFALMRGADSRLSALPVAALGGIYAVVLALGRAGVSDVWPILVAVRLIAAMFVLAAIATAIRNADEAERWHIKFLGFPLSGLYAYDLLMDAQVLAFGLWSPAMADVRGLLALLALPFLVFGTLRARLGRQPVRISHRGALYSTALIASGLYLLAIAAAAIVLEGLPDGVRLPVQVASIYTAVLLFLLLVTSGVMRAGAKGFIAGHFFARKYDYLHEWQRLLATLADAPGETPLEHRLIRAIADLVEAPGGALYVYDGGRARLIGGWNFRPRELPALPAHAFQGDGGRAAAGPLTGVTEEIWLAVPLPRGDSVVGFVALPPARAPRRLDGEDRALLMMAAQHCAAHLAEQRQSRSRAETQQFERFSRHYAFVVHDIKNVVSQLALLLKNFERHGHNPEFRRDMTDTVAHAVGRLEALTTRIQGLKAGVDREELGEAGLADVLTHEVARLQLDGGPTVRLEITPEGETARARLPWERFSAVVGHLIQNAREVSEPEAGVAVELDAAAGTAILDVVDRGPGMSAAFVEQDLFRPFRSTKPGGLGVGAYQCREFAREFGGDLDVVSAPGAGTTMRLRLPLAANASEIPEIEMETAE